MSLLRAIRAILPMSAQSRCRPETRAEQDLNDKLKDRKATRISYSAVQRRGSGR